MKLLFEAGMPTPMLAGADEPVLVSLRRATRNRHTTLEGLIRLYPPLSHQRYLDALRGLGLFHSSWEPRIDAALELPLRHWFATRSRHRLLQRDLRQLQVGSDEDRRTGSACEQAVSRIDLAGAAATFGSLYVLEGSALGGQVIARSAREMLGLGPDNGAAYFNGHDAHTAARWAEFRLLLEAQVGPSRAACQQACDAACTTFDALIATFTSLRAGDDRSS